MACKNGACCKSLRSTNLAEVLLSVGENAVVTVKLLHSGRHLPQSIREQWKANACVFPWNLLPVSASWSRSPENIATLDFFSYRTRSLTLPTAHWLRARALNRRWFSDARGIHQLSPSACTHRWAATLPPVARSKTYTQLSSRVRYTLY